MKAVVFSGWFEAPDELIEFCKNIGYENPDFKSLDLMFDKRIVDFCEQRLSKLWDENVYKGRQTYMRKIGFAGAGYIRDIDTTRKWRFKYSHVGAPIVDYVEIHVNDYGEISIVSQ